MSSIEWCKVCGGLILFPEKGHACPPEFEVWCPEEGDTEACARRFFACDHEEAAEKWAEWYDSYDEPFIAEGKASPTVFVRKVGEESVEKHVVGGEFKATYHSNEVP
jgi:hypothetical protein